MKKTININISGYVFTVDDDAYELLKDYLDTLHSAFGSHDDQAEVISDIEQRMAEIFMQTTDGGQRVITLSDVERIIARMGRPEELVDIEESEEPTHGSRSQESDHARMRDVPPPPPAPEARRRVFRNPFDKMLGGVCSGFAAYFDIDPTWVRLAAVVLAFASFSTFCVVYIVLWIVLPEAKTPMQFMQMRGESPTMDNIGKTVTDTFRRMGDDVNQAFSSAPDTIKSTGKAFADGLASFFGAVGRVLLIILVFLCCVVELGLGIGLIGCIISLIIFLTPFGASWLGFSGLEANYESGIIIISLICAIGYILAIGIPVFALIWLMLKSASSRQRRIGKGWRVAMITAWIVGIVMAGVATGVIVAHEEGADLFRHRHEVREVVYDTVVIDESAVETDTAVITDTTER